MDVIKTLSVSAFIAVLAFCAWATKDSGLAIGVRHQLDLPDMGGERRCVEVLKGGRAWHVINGHEPDSFWKAVEENPDIFLVRDCS